MRYSKWLGIFAALVLILACFIPWAYYPDIDRNFTGFFSEQNRYGKPGKFFVVFAIVSIFLCIVPKVWAKRTNMFITAILVAFAIRSFIIYASCYAGICPEKRPGIFLMLIAPILMGIAAVFPDLKLKEKE